MSTNNCTQQQGIIEQITNNAFIVRMLAVSACASCSIKGGCGMSETKEKFLTVPKKDGNYTIGDKVNVIIRDVQGLQAVFIGYIIPFILIITLLAVLTSFMKEGKAGLIALSSTAFYYLILYFLRDKLQKKFTFEISKL